MGNVNGHKGHYICKLCKGQFTEYNSRCITCKGINSLMRIDTYVKKYGERFDE